MEITGKIQLSGSEAREASLTDAIIYFMPDDMSSIKLEPAEYTLTMARKQFVPRTMAVSVGSKVNIPNIDSISHNAFSLSAPNNFDSDLYGRGQQYDFETQGPGVVRIYCNVHYHMVAYVLSLETPYHTQPNMRGEFKLTVPDMPGKVVIWHERTSDYEQSVAPGQNNEVDVNLRITKRRLPQHTNKFGSSYTRAR
jgi:plastocyanin